MSIRLEEGVSSLTNRCKWWNDHQNIALPTLTVPLSTGGGLHWLHAQPERTWSGKGRQEEGGALRAACREGGEGRCTAQFVIALWPLTLARALSALMWETWWPQRKAIFLHHGDHVCNNANGEPTQFDRPLETSFSWMFWWAEKQKSVFRLLFFFIIIIFFFYELFFSLFYFAQTLWLHMWEATPYTVSMQYWPLLVPGGVCVTDWHPWWWVVVGIIGSKWRLHCQSLHRVLIKSPSTLLCWIQCFRTEPSCLQSRTIRNIVLLPSQISWMI